MIRYFSNLWFGNNMRKNRDHAMLTYAWCAKECVNRKIMDAGCGRGFGTLILSIFAKEITAVDVWQREIDLAKHQQFFCPVNFQQIDLEKDKIDDDYDIIICFETIEHLANPEFFFENASKRCKKLIFSVPHHAPTQEDRHSYRVHKQVYDSVKDIASQVEPYFNVKWLYERKTEIREEPFKIPQRYIGIATPL